MTDIKAFLWRGALGGLIGGLLAALFQWAVTEDQIRVALAIEEANAAPGGDAPMFDRTEQVIGGMLATGHLRRCSSVSSSPSAAPCSGRCCPAAASSVGPSGWPPWCTACGSSSPT